MAANCIRGVSAVGARKALLDRALVPKPQRQNTLLRRTSVLPCYPFVDPWPGGGLRRCVVELHLPLGSFSPMGESYVTARWGKDLRIEAYPCPAIALHVERPDVSNCSEREAKSD